MIAVSPETRELARRIVALETAPAGASGEEVVRVCRKLQVPLAKLIGSTGFSSLLSRALTLARREMPALGPIQIRADGSLTGFDSAGGSEAGGEVLAAHFLGLLTTFIGDSLTRRLALEAWPEEQPGSPEPNAEGRP